jgi:vacuolar-type H+-ATPase subunit I/STV1
MTQLANVVFFFFFVEYIPVDGRKHQNISEACYMMLYFGILVLCSGWNEHCKKESLIFRVVRFTHIVVQWPLLAVLREIN